MKKKKKTKKDSTKTVADLVKKIDSIVETIEVYEINSISYKPIESLVLWFIAIGVGLFLTVFSNIDKIQVKETIPEKYILLISLILVGIGLAITSIIRLYLLLRDFVILTAKGVIKKIRYKINNETADKSDMDKFDRQHKAWIKTIDIPDVIMKLLRDGIILIVIGVLIFIGYYVYFFIKYE
jgi:hypothetical protein